MKRLTTPEFSGKKRARGFSLIEFGIVVALVAGGALFVYLVFSDRNDSATVSAEAHNFTMMAAAAQAKWRVQGGFEGISDATLISNGVVPTSMIVEDRIETRWNTQVTVAPASLGAGLDAANFAYSVPRKSCSDFIVQAGASAAQAAVEGSIVKSAATSQLSVADLGNACSSAASDPVEVELWVGRW